MKYLYILFCLFFCACSVSEQRNIVNLTKEWSGKELVFPEDFVLNVYLEDSVINYNKVKIQQYAILVYIDSIGCMSCKMNLPGWTEFILELDSISKKTIPCLFIFSPKSDGKEQVVNLLKKTHFSYPVCIDKKDSFNFLNNFPKDERFQTFLLDKDNKVLAIGNPVHNLKVKELYLKIIQGEKVEQEKESKVIKTKVNIAKNSALLGSFDWRKEQETTFTLKNAGNELLVIEGVNTSCGCTTVEFKKEPIRPEESLDLHVTYKAEHAEHFNKTITVYCNAESSPIKLTISGNAK